MEVDIRRDVLPKLNNVKRNSNGYQASCPAHQDENPSLSIAEGDDGKILFKCHAGCDFVQIVQTLGLSEREQNEQKKKEVATYDYVDENGNLLYQVVRYETKKFKIRRLDGKGNWDWKLGDTRRVIYRLPEILQARENDFYVIFCEGEKDSDNVREKLDFPSTTIALGVNSWREDYKDYLFGLNVVILPDNDKSGIEFAEKVANSIYEKAQSVRVINLPNLPEKGDVSDWIEKGGTREQLIELIENTAEWELKGEVKESVSNTKEFFVIKSSNEWIEEAKQKPVPKMLFGELWFEGELCILFADTNVGKSILAVQIADSITKGKKIAWFPLEIEPQQVLYFDFELGARQFANRYSENANGFLANEYQFSKDFLRVEINPDAHLLDGINFEEILFKQLESSIVETDVKILVVDNITYFKNDNEKAKEALPLMKRLKALKEKYDLSILALAHTPKRDLTKEITHNDLQGSKMLMNFCDSSFTIGKSAKDEKVRYIKQIKERNTGKIYGTDNVCVCQISKNNNFLSFEFFSFGSEREHLQTLNKKDRQEEIQRAKELRAEQKTVREIASIMGISVGKVHNLLNEDLEVNNSLSGVQDVHSIQDLNDVNNMNKTSTESLPF